MSPVFVYFSLSTTGTSFTDNILQIGGITHDQTMKFNAHILPDCPIHPHASQEHGIYLEHDNNFHEDLLVKDNTVLDARPPRDVLEAFANFLDSVHMEFGYRDIVLVCYNGIQWGGRVLLREFDRYEVCFPVSVVGISDPMRMAVMLFPGLPAGYKQLVRTYCYISKTRLSIIFLGGELM